MEILSFSFTRIVVKDAKALLVFYCDALGFTQALRVDHGEGDDAFVEYFLSIKQGMPPQLVLMQYLHRDAPKPGEVVVALQVDDLDAALDVVIASEGKIAVPVQDIPEHGMRLSFVEDPEGHAIELIQITSA